ncbi:MAG TPA: PilN domain-containing protein [Gaiellaceae bacterium]|nr:PilN domain-containing protein [Gaiellaceae bacterium]
MRAVNLLPKDLQTRKSLRQEDPAVVIGSALGVIVMIALGAAFMTAHSKASTEQARLTAARLQLAQLSLHRKPSPAVKKPTTPVTPVVPPPSITGQEAQWLSVVTTNLSQRIAWDRILREVSLVMPDDVTLSSLSFTAPATTPVIGVAPGTAQQGFTIAGSAFSYDSVARLLSRLQLVPDLSNVALGPVSTGASSTDSGSSGGSSTPSSAGGVTFSINASVAGPPVAAPAPVPTTPTDTTTTSG